MKKLLLLFMLFIFIFGCAGQYNTAKSKGDSGLDDWVAGDSVTKEKLNQWLNATDATAAEAAANTAKWVVLDAITGLPKVDGSGNITAAVAGTDYLAPDGDGSSLTGIEASSIATDTTDFDNKLDSDDDTIQKALDTLEDIITASAYTLVLDDTEIEIDDDGVNPATITTTIDGTVVQTQTLLGGTVGPTAITGDLADGEYSPVNLIRGIDAGATMAKGTPVILYSGVWEVAVVGVANSSPAWGVLVADVTDGSEATVMTEGTLQMDALYAWTPNAILYLHDTVDGNSDGAFSETASTTSTDHVQPCGFAIDADTVYFKFDPINGYYTVE
jgi:hypothetical protein